MVKSDNDISRIEIALAANQGYAVGLLASAASIAMSASRDVCLSFTILDGGILEQTFHDIVDCLNRNHPHVQVSRHFVDESVFAAYPSLRGNKMTYARFSLPDILKNSDHVIYCDADFLWLADISLLWAMRDDDTMVKACRDPYVMAYKQEVDWFRHHGIELKANRYFNAGLLLVNLRLMREEVFVPKVLEFLNDNRDVVFHDQSALNYLLWDRVEFLEDKWMKFTTEIKDRDLASPCVLHYVNNVPWVNYGWREDLRDTRMAWYQVLAKARRTCLWRIVRQYYGFIGAISYFMKFTLVRIPIVRQALMFFAVVSGKKCQASFLFHYARYWQAPSVRRTCKA